MDAERTRRGCWHGPLVVGIAAGVVATALGAQYLGNWPALWTDVVHDRNAHLDLGLGLASDVVHGRVAGVVRNLDRARTWPPLHDGMLVAASVAAFGMDIRAAVLPSLAAFVAAGVFAFLIARRLAGPAAGAIAAAMVLASPAMRAFATDVMLESPGAALTLAALYAAVRVRQDGTPTDWRWLAAALTGLFFLKYNYWLLVVLALLGDAGLRHGRTWLSWRPAGPLWTWRHVGGELLHPLSLLAFAGIALCAWVRFTGGGDVRLFGRVVAVRSNLNLATFAYWVVLARLGPWYWRHGRQIAAADARVSALVNGHLLPIIAWLAWPQKLACFLWVLNPADNVGEFPADGLGSGLRFYASALANDYHGDAWAAALVGVLMVIAVGAGVCGRLQPGWTAVLALVVVAGVLTVRHPNRKSRFLHSWLPAVWVLAGAGMASLPRRTPGANWLAAATAGAVVLFQLPELFSQPHAPEGGLRLERPSAVAITDSYLEHLDGARRPAILSNVPLKFLARWTYLDRYGRGHRPLTEIPGFDATSVSASNDAVMDRWLAATDCDVLVWIDISPGSPWFVPVPGCDGLSQIGKRLGGGSAPMHQQTLTDGTRVLVWRRPVAPLSRR